MQGGTPLHMGYPMCNSHLKTRKENSYAKANFKFYLMCGADMRTFSNDSNGHGYPNGLFGINDTITRGQIATILWRMEESPVVNYARRDRGMSMGGMER